MRRIFSFGWAVVPLALSAIAFPSAAIADQGTPPEIELTESAVIVHGVPIGHSVLIFGCGQDVQHYVTTLRRWEKILEHRDRADPTVELDHPVPLASVWLAADLTTGLSGVAVPSGMPLRDLPHPLHRPAETATDLALELQMAELVLVRPGAGGGVWGLRIGDGGAADADSLTNGVLRAEVKNMWSVGESPPAPKGLAAGDLVLVVDPNELAYAVTTVSSKGEHQ